MMFLPLGDDFSVKASSVVLILDADTATRGQATRELWKKAQESGLLVDCSGDLPRSLVLVKEPAKDAVLYLSRASAKTLGERGSDEKRKAKL